MSNVYLYLPGFNAAMGDSDGSDHLDGNVSEELFDASDDSHRSRSPMSPRTYRYTPPVPATSERLTFSEPPRKIPAASRNCCDVVPAPNGRYKTGRDGFRSVGQSQSATITRPY